MERVQYLVTEHLCIKFGTYLQNNDVLWLVLIHLVKWNTLCFHFSEEPRKYKKSMYVYLLVDIRVKPKNL